MAERLLAAKRAGINPPVHDAVLVYEMLRGPLTRFAGADGFAALWRRSLALAGADFPSLRSVKVGGDGQLEGLDAVDREATVALAAQMFDLLIVFIGEPFTLKIVHEAWPGGSPDHDQPGKEANL